MEGKLKNEMSTCELITNLSDYFPTLIKIRKQHL